MAEPSSRDWMWNEACMMMERAARMHREFFRPGPHHELAPGWEPPIDIFETDIAVEIIVALPGVEPKDLAVELKSGEVVVSGYRRLPQFRRETAIHRLEIPHGRFERRILISAGLLELTRSELDGGCLRLVLAKRG
jgi:HSP20 family molecular chaperone IbpA